MVNSWGLAFGMPLKFYAFVAKGLKLKVRTFLRLILTFVGVTGENLRLCYFLMKNYKVDIR